MQNITDSELQREVEALKSHRRISVNRPILDPDLPDMAAIRGGGQEIMSAAAGSQSQLSPQRQSSTKSSGSHHSSGSLKHLHEHRSPSAAPSPESGHRQGYSLNDDGPKAYADSSTEFSAPRPTRQAFSARRRGVDGVTSVDTSVGRTASPTGSSSSRGRSPVSAGGASASSNSDKPLRPTDPSHLFWVPASVHPEISPSHFRQFLQDHASRAVRGDGSTTPESASGSPASSAGSTSYGVVSSPPTSPTIGASDSTPISPMTVASRQNSIARRGSTLRRQYRPENDTDDDEMPNAGGCRPSLSSARSREGEPSLSIKDLQRLEALAEEASKSMDETELRSVLRRTMSLGAGSSTMDTVDALPAGTEDPDAPIIVPPPGQILRRAARTKIRKSSMSGADAERGGAGSRLSRRRALVGGSMASSAGSDTPSESGEGETRASQPDLASLGLSLMQRRPSDASEISSGEDDQEKETTSRPTSEGATDSIVDAYSRDSIISNGTERTSVTSFNDGDTFDGLLNKWGLQDKPSSLSPSKQRELHQQQQPTRPSPPDTPTQSSVRGYFDVPSRQAPSPAKLTSTQASASSSIDTSKTASGPNNLVESPLQSPEREMQPTPMPTGRSSAEQQPPQASWPVPVSHVPPVPSFEKTRPATQGITTQNLGQAAPAQPSTLGQATASRGLESRESHRPQTAGLSVPPPTGRTKEKEKRSGGFASWFGIGKDDDDGRPSNKEERRREKAIRKEREREGEASTSSGSALPAAATAALAIGGQYGQPNAATSASSTTSSSKGDKEKDVGSFLGALFGKKKGQDDGSGSHRDHRHEGQLTAGSLLDQRYSGNRAIMNNYSRYPIHIERAVYRLSHIKLANPRRALYEQVLISNLMFWYLSIVNKSQQQPSQQHQQQSREAQRQQPQQSSSAPPNANKGQIAASKTSEPVSSRESPSTSAGSMYADDASKSIGVDDAKSAHGSPSAKVDQSTIEPVGQPSKTANPVAQPVAKAKKTGLVKPNRAPPGGRSAETPILAAGYGAQHRQMSSDLAYHQQQQQSQHHQSQQNQHHQYQQGASLGGIAVGQVVDPRALQYSYLQQQQGSADAHSGDSTDNVHQGEGDEHRSSVVSRNAGIEGRSNGARTSPGLSAQRVRGASGSHSSAGGLSVSTSEGRDLISSSGAWLGGNKGNHLATSPTSTANDEQAWLGGGSGGRATEGGQSFDAGGGSYADQQQKSSSYQRPQPVRQTSDTLRYAQQDRRGQGLQQQQQQQPVSTSNGSAGLGTLRNRVPSAGSLSASFKSIGGNSKISQGNEQSGPMNTMTDPGQWGQAERGPGGAKSGSGQPHWPRAGGMPRSVSGPAYSSPEQQSYYYQQQQQQQQQQYRHNTGSASDPRSMQQHVGVPPSTSTNILEAPRSGHGRRQ
ncbi:unnamed protein product [Jaminaea pallidilutea]